MRGRTVHRRCCTFRISVSGLQKNSYLPRRPPLRRSIGLPSGDGGSSLMMCIFLLPAHPLLEVLQSLDNLNTAQPERIDHDLALVVIVLSVAHEQDGLGRGNRSQDHATF
jgi:hypothetical protein